MPIVATFTVKKHEEHGEIGLAQNGRPWAEPFTGMAIAHDMLEHFPDDDGSTEHELMALGALLFVRDNGAYFAMQGLYYTDAANHIESDIFQQARYLDQARRTTLRSPGRTRAIEFHEIESSIQDACNGAVCVARAETYEGDELPPFLAKGELWKVIGWMRRGYRKARRRYRKYPEWKLCHVFGLIEKEADKLIKHHDFEGQEFKISVDIGSERVTWTDVTPNY